MVTVTNSSGVEHKEALSPEAVKQYMQDHRVLQALESGIAEAVTKQSTTPLADVGLALLAGPAAKEPSRPLSLPKQVAQVGGIAKWNEQSTLAQQAKMLDAACTAAGREVCVRTQRGRFF